MDYQKLIEYLNNQDHFVKEIGITIVEIREGFAVVKLEPTTMHTNANNFINGGALYTLADFAGVCAASSYGYRITTITGNVNYLRAVKSGDEIYAVARVSKAGHKIIDIDVQIVDKNGEFYIESTFTFFNLEQKLDFLEA